METERKGVTHVPTSEGKTVWMVGTDLITFKATTETTGGSYALFDSLVLPGGGPPPHIHHREDESFYAYWKESSSFWTGTTGPRRVPDLSSTSLKAPCTR